MTSLSTASASPFVKMLMIGDSGTGKTGALASLVRDGGYKLYILDMDNKVKNGILPIILKRDCPDKIKNIDVESFRDNLKASSVGHVFDGQPTAYPSALALLDKWSDGSIPRQWGKDTIFVLDSLTFFATAAFNWAKSMNPAAKEPRTWYFTAQGAVMNTLSELTSDRFNAHVIVICHVRWINRPDGAMRGYPKAIGEAISSDIPTYFESMALTQSTGSGQNVKRTIQTATTALIDLKNPASFKMLPTLPIETGLADFFKTLRS